jgi:GGDEF domain-containing protein
MSNPIRISSRAIQCVADAEGATEYAIRYGGRDFIVTAHSKAEAEHAAEFYRPETADESQPDLIK